MRDHGRERGRGRHNRGGPRGGPGRYRARGRDHHDNRGRGNYTGDRHEHDGPRRMYQRGFIAPPPEEESPRKKLLQLLAGLGQVPAVTDGMAEEAARAAESMVEQQVREAYQTVTHILNEQPISTVLDAFWDILLAKPHRVPYFAVLVSLLNNTSVEASEAISMDCGRRLTSALKQEAKANPGKTLPNNAVVKAVLRFECSLAALGVLSTRSVLNQLAALVDRALELVAKADNGRAALAGAAQPYADFLVESALLALPWGGASLWDAEPTAADAILSQVQEYLAARPRKGFPEMSPWLQMTPEDTLPVPPDSTDFLPHLFAAIQDLKANGWVVNCVPKPQTHVDNAFNSGAIFEVPQATVPSTPPSTPGDTLGDSFYSPLYPPRGLWPILPPHIERAPEDTNEMDVIIAQEYYMHVLQAYASNGKVCVDELTAGVPVAFPSVSLLVELLISQMLLPAPPLLVFAYQSMLVRLVEVVGQPVARAFGGCMKTLFESATCMDIIHLNRVADLLAWFVSNNNYQWPWARWDRVLEASQLNAQRRFCSLALAKMIRLCANLAYIQQHILPQDDRWLTLIPPSDQPTAPPPDPDNPGGLVQPYEDIMDGLMSKISDDSMEDKLRKCGEESEGGLRHVLGYFVRTLLFRARTSPFHTETLLNRYQNTLKNMIASLEQQEDGQSPQLVLLSATEAVWRCSSQRATLTIVRFVSDGFVSIQDVLKWAFASAQGSSSDKPGTIVPRIVSEDEVTATMALETVVSLFVTLVDQAEACNERAQELESQLPTLQAEAASAEQDMVTAQQQSQDSEITDEGREALLEKIQELSAAESEVKERLSTAEQAIEQSRERLDTLRQSSQEALESVMTHFLTSAEHLPPAAPAEENKMDTNEDAPAGPPPSHKGLLLNTMASFARHVMTLASGTVNVKDAVAKAQQQCGQGSPEVQHALSVVLPQVA